ncbi:hypothetical protein BDV18DRAFT_159151 [Aspergillus unguis]
MELANTQVKKRIRKPRGRGLRTNTGCLTCRTRHKKCDEQKPRCGPCTTSDRECIFPNHADTKSSASPKPALPSRSSIQNIQNILCSPHSGTSGPTPTPAAVGAGAGAGAPTPTPPVAPTLDYDATAGPSPETHDILDPELVALYPDTRPRSHMQWEPDVNNPDHASAQWLNLLATDAAQGGDFRLAQHHHLQTENRLSIPRSQSQQHALYPEPEPERQAWQADADIVLSSHEAALFREFAERIALFLDVFDPHRHFSTYATRLALRNVGLMKAILALSARYSSLSSSETSDHSAIQFYYETLHYVSTALQYNSYKHSEELLATAIVVSTYEMLDASEHNSNWQRHLKGVFWIQRSQNVNGASGGLRQAVWWAWLRQDLWAAFREHRRCFSFWQPVVDYPDLSEDELAYRSVYLLSQAVNYCTDPLPNVAPEESDPEQVRLRIERGNELMDMLERWHSFAAPSFRAFPCENTTDVHGWTPLWIHPPAFGVALQLYSFARILVCLHRPISTGFTGYRQFQKTLGEAVATICGIAMELREPSCLIVSALCLFGAGLCVQDREKQEAIAALIQGCERRTGWPLQGLLKDLRREWERNGPPNSM